MTTNQKKILEEFVGYLKELAPTYNIKCYSAPLAQFILESAHFESELAINAHNYAGLKYRKNRCSSSCGIYYKVGSEQNADGSYSSSAMQWFKFENRKDFVKGYLDFINISNYKSLKGITDPEEYLTKIKAAGYATSLKYVENCMNVVKKYNLIQYDPVITNNSNNTSVLSENSSLVTYTNISPNKTSPRNHKIDTITIHCIVGQWTAKQGCDYFVNSSLKAAPNYVVGKDGSIGLSVEEKDRSWCSSNAANDNRAITIEVASDKTHPYAVTDKAYEALIELVADICKRNGIKELKWQGDKSLVGQVDKQNMTAHRWFKSKKCPGEYLYSRYGEIAERVNKKLGVTTTQPETTTSTIDPYTKTTYTVVKGDTLSKIGVKTGIDWKTIAEINGIGKPYTIRVGQVLQLKRNTVSTSSLGKIDIDTVFDYRFYYNKYADLRAAFGFNEKLLRKHFEEYGIKEGRQAIKTFNPQNYKNRYADLRVAFGNDWKRYYEHWCTYGIKEKRVGT